MANKKAPKYKNFMEVNSVFVAIEAPQNEVPKLPAGVYDLKIDQKGTIFYDMIDTNHDKILDLPTPEYGLVVRQIERFLTERCRNRFKEKSYLYKRSTLLYGKPGTGKTCIVNRVVDTVIAKNGVVLFNPNPKILPAALSQLQDIQPETTVVVIFEELDRLVSQYEGDLLNILDGEIQRENVIFIATTNFFHQIPPRLKRPGRFGRSIKVGFPDAATRLFYLEHKLGKEYDDLNRWVQMTEGFSIDELSSLVREVYCLEEGLEDTINYMKELKKEAGGDSREDENPYDDDCEEEELSDIMDQMLELSERRKNRR